MTRREVRIAAIEERAEMRENRRKRRAFHAVGSDRQNAAVLYREAVTLRERLFLARVGEGVARWRLTAR